MSAPSTHRSRRPQPIRVLIAAAACAATVTSLAACSALKDPGGTSPSPAGSTTSSSSSSSSASSSASAPSTTPSTSSSAPKPVGAPVHISALQNDGDTFGIGMPLVIRFSRSIGSARAFVSVAKVTINGRDAGGSWYFEKPYQDSPMEAHYRPQSYWPAHSKVHVDIPVKNRGAGPGLLFDNDLTLDYSIGASHVSVIDAQALTMTTYSDGKKVKVVPVSLGAAKTPTFSGVKVVMERNRNERMVGPGYDEIVPWSVRITSSGEFIHAAGWNSNIGLASTSNGCTNLRVQDAIWFFNFSQIGDIATYPNAPGAKQPSWDGFGDWNLPWSVWQSGGLLRTN